MLGFVWCLLVVVCWSMVDLGRALVLWCSVPRGCAALFCRPLRRSIADLGGSSGLLVSSSVLSCCVDLRRTLVLCCSVHRGCAALSSRPLRRSVADLGRPSVVLFLSLVLSYCIVVLSVDLWWIGPSSLLYNSPVVMYCFALSSRLPVFDGFWPALRTLSCFVSNLFASSWCLYLSTYLGTQPRMESGCSLLAILYAEFFFSYFLKLKTLKLLGSNVMVWMGLINM
ncbi:hypothetical protein GOP47_0013051 [Adiantum capillus-veneris]|uniref:Uncharacterized protein n=1 Tax=Adiantum capillus-veneris TaxID=13818 RepID=A0A9D4URV5_ADICA|nr:hypothetical protein GOP47_0013051 [Adiantum capillus-veneris]